MKIIGMMPVRNEEWCLGLTLPAALKWLDEIVILDHASTDRTHDILCAADPYRVTILNAPDPTWTEMAHRQLMLEAARKQGATHLVRIDADEILTGDLLPDIRGIVEHLGQGEILSVLRLNLARRSNRDVYALPRMGTLRTLSDDHWTKWTGLGAREKRRAIDGLQAKGLRVQGRGNDAQYSFDRNTWDRWLESQSRWGNGPPLNALGREIRNISSGPWSRELMSLCWKEDARLYYQADEDGYDFHRAIPYLSDGARSYWTQQFLGVSPEGKRTGGILHLQFLSERAMRAKCALYQMTEVLRWPGRRTPQQLRELYCPGVYEAECAETEPIPESWLEPYRDLLQYLNIDREPWQEAEVKRLWAEHGPDKFKGLDLFGVVKWANQSNRTSKAGPSSK